MNDNPTQNVALDVDAGNGMTTDLPSAGFWGFWRRLFPRHPPPTKAELLRPLIVLNIGLALNAVVLALMLIIPMYYSDAEAGVFRSFEICCASMQLVGALVNIVVFYIVAKQQP